MGGSELSVPEVLEQRPVWGMLWKGKDFLGFVY